MDCTSIQLKEDEAETVTVEGANAYVQRDWCGGKKLVIEPPAPAGHALGSVVEYPIKKEGRVISIIQFWRVEADLLFISRRLRASTRAAVFVAALSTKLPAQYQKIVGLAGIGAAVAVDVVGCTREYFTSWRHRIVPQPAG
jgi:hypothetical protein